MAKQRLGLMLPTVMTAAMPSWAAHLCPAVQVARTACCQTGSTRTSCLALVQEPWPLVAPWMGALPV